MKYAWIDEHRDRYTVSQLCRVLGVSRSGYCQWRVRPPSVRALANQALDTRVATIYQVSRRSYGHPRVIQSLRQPLAPNLLERRFDGWQPDQAWVADITYVPTGEGWLYLAAVMDLAGRRIVGWSISEAIDATLVCTALKSAWWQHKLGKGLFVGT